MAGGIGSRFWPLSKESFPKQFLDILDTGETLIQQTFNRLKKTCFVENIFIVTNKKYKDLCLAQLPEIFKNNILCEPVMRNTAPSIAYACFKIQSINDRANILIAASDHVIDKQEEFIRIVDNCFDIVAQNNILLTFGIKPSHAETGYGYIQFTDHRLNNFNIVKKVKSFTEKPDQELANSFLDSGDFLWNSGMFIWNVQSIALAFRKQLRDIYDVFEEGKEFYNTDKEIEFINRMYASCKNISVDYGIMEKSDNVYVYPADFGWSDLGTWGSLYKRLSHDKEQNAIKVNKVMLYDSYNNIVKMPNDKIVIAQGLDGYIMVEHEGILLICKQEEEQRIKEFVSNLKA